MSHAIKPLLVVRREVVIRTVRVSKTLIGVSRRKLVENLLLGSRLRKLGSRLRKLSRKLISYMR